MAKVVLNRQSISANIIRVETDGVLGKNTIENKDEKIQFYPDRPIRVEVNGNINRLHINETATILGNIKFADIRNLCYCDGEVQVSSVGNAIVYFNNLKILGSGQKIVMNNKKKVNSNYKPLNNSSTVETKSAQVVHIDGYLDILVVDIQNKDCEVIIKGDIDRCWVGNSLFVNGNIRKCKVGNVLTLSEKE